MKIYPRTVYIVKDKGALDVRLPTRKVMKLIRLINRGTSGKKGRDE